METELKVGFSGDKMQMRPAGPLRDGLIDFCRAVAGVETVVEIGSYRGESAAIMLEQLPGARIVCVDLWNLDGIQFHDGAERDFDRRLLNNPRIVKMKMDSRDAARMVGQVDLVYIDGDHSYRSAKTDVEIWGPKATKYIAGHDYTWETVARAVHDTLGKPDMVFQDSSWIVKV